MKQDISALMDGELFEDEAESVFDRVKRDQSGNQDWGLYHLIGDALRQPDHIHCDLGVKVRERLDDEPTVLAPRAIATGRKIGAIAWSAAASLAAVGVVAWMAAQIGSEPVVQMAISQPDLRSVAAVTAPSANDYLMAHQEFSPSTQMNGGASYIRTASYRDNQ